MVLLWLPIWRRSTQTHSPSPPFGVHCYAYAQRNHISVVFGEGQEMNPTKSGSVVSSGAAAGARRDTLTIIDNRNGRQYEIPIKNDTIRPLDLRQIKIQESDFGMMSYDPAFSNTASCESKITFIDGDK